jgi:hypothetical protein
MEVGYGDKVQEDPKGTSKSQEVTQMLILLPPHYTVFFPTCICGLIEEIPYGHLAEEENI